jgi:phenylacetate-CoA ligase
MDGSAERTFMAALAKTERLPKADLEAYQRRLLDRLVRHAVAETGFYPDRLRPLFRTDGSIDWERWQDIPILTRSEAQAETEALRARSVPPAAGAIHEDMSSGSTGRPFRHWVTSIQHVGSACCSERFFNWHGLRPERLAGRIRAAASPEAAYPHGRTMKGWRVGHPESTVVDLSIAATVEQQMEWLSRTRPAYLMSYPSNLRMLIQRAEQAGETIRCDALLTFGEMLTADARTEIAGHFGLEPLDRYGASEVGHIAGTCPHSFKLHVSSEVVLLEIVGEDGRVAEAGASGRVVVTPFYNWAMPLIRYDIGDYAALSEEPCGCGRTLPLLERVLGRTRNMFHFIDGTSVWPVLLSSAIGRFLPNRQFQVVQTALDQIDIRYVPVSPDQVDDLPGLEAYVRMRLHPSLALSVTPVEAIPRSAGGKFEDYLCLVERLG